MQSDCLVPMGGAFELPIQWNQHLGVVDHSRVTPCPSLLLTHLLLSALQSLRIALAVGASAERRKQVFEQSLKQSQKAAHRLGDDLLVAELEDAG